MDFKDDAVPSTWEESSSNEARDDFRPSWIDWDDDYSDDSECEPTEDELLYGNGSTTSLRVVYSERDLIQHYLKVSVAHGHPARAHELIAWGKEHGGPGAHIYFRDFGSLHVVRARAKLQDCAFLTRKDMVECYARLCEELARPARSRDLERESKNGRCPTYYRYLQVFGSLDAVRDDAGVSFPDNKEQKLIWKYRALAQRLRRTPDSHDMARAKKRGKLRTRKHYENTFGSLTEFQRSLGLPPSYRKLRWPWTPVLLFQFIDDVAGELGRTPEAMDMIEASRAIRFRDGKRIATPKLTYYQYWFGSFEEALWQGCFVDRESQQLRMMDSFAAEIRGACSKGLSSITMRELRRAANKGIIPPLWVLEQWFGGVPKACRYADVRLVDEL